MGKNKEERVRVKKVTCQFFLAQTGKNKKRDGNLEHKKTETNKTIDITMKSLILAQDER